MKIKSLLTAACLLMALVPRPSAAQKIRVAYVSPSAVLSIPRIANDAGILAKYGLEAELILLTGSPRLVQSLIAGDIDLSVVGITAVMRARIRGADVVILANPSNVPNQKLMVSHASKIHRLEDLRGVTIGVSQYGSEADTFARIALSKAGLRPDKDAAILQLGGHPQVAAALVAGGIEAGVLGGLATLTAQKSGARVLTSGLEQQTISPAGTLAATGAYVQRNHNTVARFMRAFVEGIHYFKTNPAGTIAILQKHLGLNTEQTRFLYEEQVNLFEPFPLPSDKALQAILDRESDPKARNFKPADFVDLSFLREIEKSGLMENLYRK